MDAPQVVYVLEFKVLELEGDGIKAIHQIKDKGYQQQYVQAGRKVILIGMDFSKAERNLVVLSGRSVDSRLLMSA
ncbi:MAG: PD-(D/E)XK nuclease domain-containing protein [Desulfohalobiaceae bacterium]